ncbi:DUF4377 domain-containing protein [Tenacibaculum sp. TC6]|uniref:DUF4377 domain-containing protein n=1 Tax=Tenacibaculum sp. TC6 TaxID=3423223 RepID=UPI003D367B4A
MKNLLHAKIDSLFKTMRLSNSKTTQRQKLLFVASKRIINKGLLIKERTNEKWTYFYKDIKGFMYEDGYEYEILVSYHSSQENSADSCFSLVRVLTKTKKESYNLPN